MKKCTKCKEEKALDNFNFKVKLSGIRHSQCKNCTRLFVKNHYNNNRAYYLNKTHKRNWAIRQRLNEHIKEYLLKNRCVDCGESDITVLEFDHQDRTSKLDSISSLIRARSSLEIVQKEIEKCCVRCANCHRRRTAKQFKWLKITRS